MLPQNKNSHMDELNDLIKIYDNVLSKEICEKLISFYEENSDKHEVIDNDGYPTFTQLNLTENKSHINDIHNLLIKTVFEYRDRYYQYICRDVFPPSHAFEQFRIKKYKPTGNDRFDTHVDVKDYQSARRFLSFFWYLNDVDDGGKTIFKDMEIKPSMGTLIVFPPLWMFPHKGEPPISSSKYLLSTYLHYQ